MQTIDLVDKISEAVDKINENFTSVDSDLNQVSSGGVDSSSVINIIDGHLDSAYFTSTINEGYLNQFTISQSVDLTSVNNDIQANSQAILSLESAVNDSGGVVSALSSQVTNLETQLQGNINIDSATLTSVLASSQAFQGLVSQTDFDSEVGVLSQDITILQNSLTFTDSDGQTVSNIAEVMQTLTAEIETVEGQIVTNATWNLNLIAGTEDSPRFAGLQFGNNGDSASMVIMADKFEIISPDTINSPIKPFTVNANGATLTNVKITGNLDIGSDLTGARMEIKDDVTKIFDTNGQIRVQLGNLSGQ